MYIISHNYAKANVYNRAPKLHKISVQMELLSLGGGGEWEGSLFGRYLLAGTTSEGPFYLLPLLDGNYLGRSLLPFTFYLLPLLDGNHLGRFLLPITNYYQLPRKVPITDSGMVDMGFPT